MRAFVNCRAYVFDPVERRYEIARSFAVEEGRFVARGPSATLEPPLDLGGATVVPAFTDCHVHLLETGLLLGARDLSGARDARAFEAAVAALPAGAFVYAGK